MHIAWYLVILFNPNHEPFNPFEPRNPLKPTTELYYKYAGVITSVVNSYAWDCPKDIQDEMMLQAELVFCEACLSYDPDHPSKASFETWLRNQLKSITCVIRKASKGPSLLKNCNASAVTVNMLAQNISREEDEDEDPVDISDVTPNWVLEDYSAKLLNGVDHCEFPEEMHPYIKALQGDSLRIFQDFCRGKFNLKPQKFMTVAKRKAREVLNPTRLYRRLYMQEGWSLERVRNAWRGLRGVFNAYNKGTFPMLVCDPKFRPADVASEITKSNNPRYINFAKRHKISYWNYKALVKRGIIPELAKGEENLDLSIYAATAC